METFGPSNVIVSGLYFIQTSNHFLFLLQEFSETFYIRQQWNDPRLSFRNKYPTLERLSLWEKDIDSFWKPDLFVANEKSSTGHQLFTEHRFMRVSPNGDVMYGVE